MAPLMQLGLFRTVQGLKVKRAAATPNQKLNRAVTVLSESAHSRPRVARPAFARGQKHRRPPRARRHRECGAVPRSSRSLGSDQRDYLALPSAFYSHWPKSGRVHPISIRVELVSPRIRFKGVFRELARLSSKCDSIDLLFGLKRFRSRIVGADPLRK